MIALALALCCLGPQDTQIELQPPRLPTVGAFKNGVSIVVVSEVVERGRFPLAALQLGDGGGVVRAVDAAARKGATREPTSILTSGGVRITARREGVKLDSPSGRELLLTPSGQPHLRDGAMGPTFSRGIQLWFADGTLLRMRKMSSGSRHPFELVELVDSGRASLVWHEPKRIRGPQLNRRFNEPSWAVLGEGEVIYRILPLGPIFVAERIVCPKDQRAKLPEVKVVICGDALAESLRRYARLVPQHVSEYPEARRVIDGLAAASARVFAGTRVRPVGLATPSVPMLDGFELKLSVRSGGPMVLALHHPSREAAYVEWTVSETTRLHIVQPKGGREGRPRYVLQGHIMRDLVDTLMPFRPTSGDRGRGRKLLFDVVRDS